MSMERAAVWLAVMCMCTVAGLAQAPATATQTTAAGQGPSAVLQPALDTVHSTLAGVRTDKWKRGSVRDEAGMDIGSLNSDMQLNLPPLLHAADGAPGSLSRLVPVARHVDAFYDVLLRVVEAARISAPGDQADALQQALVTLSKARLALYDRMNDAAIAQEKQVADLRATVQKQAAFKCPAPPPEKPCPTPVHKRKAKPKAATPKPAAPATTPKTNP